MEYEISENEHLQSIREFYTLHDIKYKYPKCLITKTLIKYQKMFINSICFIEFYSEFLYDNSINKILLIDTLCENIRIKIKDIEETGYEFIRHRKIIMMTYNSIRDLNPIYYFKKNT